MSNNFYILDERDVWHEAIGAAARKRGFNPVRIRRAFEVTEPGWVFIRPHATPHILKQNQADAAELIGKGCPLVQDWAQIMFYEDKIEQYCRWTRWLPNTWVCHSRGYAEIAAHDLGFPLVSKAAQGASSANVRVLNNRHELYDHLDRIFNGPGVPVKHCDSRGTQSMQQGYVLLQEFIPHDVTYRVNIIGGGRAVFKRYNYADRPVAQTGNVDPVTELGLFEQDLLKFANAVAADIGTRWCALDILARGDRFYLLETSLAWPWPPTRKDIANAPIFNTRYKWRDLFECMFDEIITVPPTAQDLAP